MSVDIKDNASLLARIEAEHEAVEGAYKRAHERVADWTNVREVEDLLYFAGAIHVLGRIAHILRSCDNPESERAVNYPTLESRIALITVTCVEWASHNRGQWSGTDYGTRASENTIRDAAMSLAHYVNEPWGSSTWRWVGRA